MAIAVQPAGTRTRLVSLDVFRGLTMAAMVIVNNPGDWGNIYWPLEHAAWNGWTPTDLIFPFFVFIVGVSITLSRKSASWGSIARRAVLIIAVGLFLAGYPRFDIHRWRFPGVLQRIGVCYFFAAAFYKMTRASGRWRQGMWMVVASLVLCAGYWLVLRGDMTPEGNLGARIDRAVFGAHLWVSSKTWDPEGLLSTVPAIATALLGVAAGVWLGSDAAPRRKVRLLAAAGVAAMAVGYAWHPFFPINKSLWTSSYVFFTAGAAAVLLALLSAAVDRPAPAAAESVSRSDERRAAGEKGGLTPAAEVSRWWVRVAVILGTNALTLFAVSALLVKTLGLIKITEPDGRLVSASRWIYVHAFVPVAPPKIASLLYAVANLAVLFALLAWMHRRRLFLRV